MKKLYLARNNDGRLFLFNEKPIKLELSGYWSILGDPDIFNSKYSIEVTDMIDTEDVKWEDEEPQGYRSYYKIP